MTDPQDGCSRCYAQLWRRRLRFYEVQHEDHADQKKLLPQ